MSMKKNWQKFWIIGRTYYISINDILLRVMKPSDIIRLELVFDVLKTRHELNSPFTMIFNVDDIPIMWSVFSHNELRIFSQHEQLRGFLFWIMRRNIL